MAALPDSVTALLEGRWGDWHGVSADFTLAALDAQLQGSSVLDAQAVLGIERLPCTRSGMNGAPLEAWHRSGQVLLLARDFESSPMRVPAATAGRRLDAVWGAATLRGAEWVYPEQGLALLVVPGNKVVRAFGFAPTTMTAYLATRRPAAQRAVLEPLQPLQRGTPR